jgi:signal transduction histidine kinase
VLLLVGLASLPALAFLLYSASQQRHAARQKVEHDAIRLARLASREHARQITGARELLSTLSRVPLGWRRGLVQCPEFLPAVLRGFRYFANLGVLSPAGKIFCSVVPPPGEIDMGALPVFRRALASHQVEVGEYQIGLIVRKPVLILASAVRDGTGAVQAVPFVALDLAWFNQLPEEADLPPDSVFTIADRRGTILMRSVDSEKWVGTMMPRARETRERRQGVIDRTDPDGVRRLVAFAPLAGIDGVQVSVAIPADRAFSAANRTLALSLVGFGLILLFVAVAGSLGAELFVLRGIRDLERATHRLGTGDLSVRSRVRDGEGEIAELARAFNDMADALQQREADATSARRELEASEERLRALSQRLQRVRDEEATRIARDLHDELGQTLTVLKLDLAWLGRRLKAADRMSEALAERVAGMVALVDENVRFVRKIATELRPGVLDQVGLAAALEWQARDFAARTQIHCDLHLGPVRSGLGPDLSTAVFRIFQEALTNVSRHAKARSIQVDLREEESVLSMVVRDDGAGISPGDASGEASIGILGMRERAHLVGGELEVAGAPGRGTTVSVRIPLGAPC